MSRSRKKGIIKDKPRNYNRTSLYWGVIRSATKNVIRSCKDLEELEIPDPKTIINDYTYCDYIIDYEHENRSKWWKRGEVDSYAIRSRRK